MVLMLLAGKSMGICSNTADKMSERVASSMVPCKHIVTEATDTK